MSRTRIAVILAGLGVVAVLIPLPGHAVSPRALSGLALRGGRPVVLLYDCPRYPIDEISIVPTSGTVTMPENAKGWAVHRSASAALPEFVPVLGAAPAGWSRQDTSGLTTGTTGPELTSLVPGPEYRLGVYSRRDDHGRGTPFVDFDFTVGDVNALTPGEVLVSHGKTFGEVTEARFRAAAKDGC